MIRKVTLSLRALKDLRACPLQVRRKLLAWVDAVERRGLEEIRKQPGYHDEPLAGDRAGQRSIRLSRRFRAFYFVRNGDVTFVEVVEVNAHKY